MLLEEATGIIDEYAKWIRDNMKAVQQGDGVRIIGPMLDRHNDCMSVYLADSPDGGYILTDLGETVGDLEFSGVNILKSSGRLEKLNATLNGYGVEHKDGEIFVGSSRDDLVLKMNMLFQAMASVDDLFFTSNESARNLFAEIVREWMLEKDIRAVSGPSLTGKSGLLYKYDFAIPPSRRSPERLVKMVNSPRLTNVQNALFGWQDVENARGLSKGFVILNAKGAQGEEISSDITRACKTYGIQPIRWGIDENDFAGELAA